MRWAPWGHSSCGKAAATQPQMPPAVPFALLSCHVSGIGPLPSQTYSVMPVIPWPPTRVLSFPSSPFIPKPCISCLLEDGRIIVVCNDSSCAAPQLLPACHLHTPVTSQSVFQHSPTSKDHYKQMSNSKTDFPFVFNRDGEFPV